MKITFILALSKTLGKIIEKLVIRYIGEKKKLINEISLNYASKRPHIKREKMFRILRRL